MKNYIIKNSTRGCISSIQQSKKNYLSLNGKSYSIFNDLVISIEQINYIAKEIADKLGSNYMNQNLLFLHIKEGSLEFGNKIIEYYKEKFLNFDIGTVKINSYYGFKSVKPKLVEPLNCKRQLIEYDKIIIFDDLLDTGNTIDFLLERYFKCIQKNKVIICFLLEKDKSRAKKIINKLEQYEVLVGLQIEDSWVVGTGLDIRLPQDDKNTIYHLFRKDIEGGIYVFNKSIEHILLKDYSLDADYVRNKLFKYVTMK